LLLSRRFKVSVKKIREHNIYGEELQAELIYGVLEDESIVLSTRRYKDSDKYRVRISIYKDLSDLADDIESLGFRVYGEEDRTIIIGYFNREQIVNKLSSLLDMLI